VYRWDFDDPTRRHFATLSSAGQEELPAFMNAAVLVGPIEYNAILASPLTQPSYCARRISADITKTRHVPGLPPDDLVLVGQIQWLGE
jgi:hypothetical protein